MDDVFVVEEGYQQCNGLTCREKIIVDDAFVVEEDHQQCFDLGFLQSTLFWSRESR